MDIRKMAPTISDSSYSVCRYFARGMCRFGDMCRFNHPVSDEMEVAGLPPRDRSLEPTTSSAATSSSRARPSSKSQDLKDWVLAPVFVPKSQQWTSAGPGTSTGPRKDIASCSVEHAVGETYASVVVGPGGAHSCDNVNVTLCPYQYNCPYGEMCSYEHNELCEMCGRYSLHPSDKDQRRTHIAQCIQQHEKDMELSFAIARSKDKTCGICFEIIVEKTGREQRFGILPNCNHIFCLECIRKWRQAKQFDNKIIRACPECRIPSDYVCPSAFWVETKDDKDKLIVEYKKALGEKDCKYFKKGEGKCPFGNKCFYKHALPCGERVDVGMPKRNKRKIQRSDDEILDLFDFYLWNFVDRREFQWLEILSNLSDSGDSDWSEDFE